MTSPGTAFTGMINSSAVQTDVAVPPIMGQGLSTLSTSNLRLSLLHGVVESLNEQLGHHISLKFAHLRAGREDHEHVVAVYDPME
jgi:hypothetical protein